MLKGAGSYTFICLSAEGKRFRKKNDVLPKALRMAGNTLNLLVLLWGAEFPGVRGKGLGGLQGTHHLPEDDAEICPVSY